MCPSVLTSPTYIKDVSHLHCEYDEMKRSRDNIASNRIWWTYISESMIWLLIGLSESLVSSSTTRLVFYKEFYFTRTTEIIFWNTLTIHDKVSIQMAFYTQFLNYVNELYYLCYFARG